jgi:hypothetical protein
MNIHSTNISSAKPIPAARHLKPSTEEIKFATKRIGCHFGCVQRGRRLCNSDR